MREPDGAEPDGANSSFYRCFQGTKEMPASHVLVQVGKVVLGASKGSEFTFALLPRQHSLTC